MKPNKNIKQKMQKCLKSPYYFATTYLTIKNNNGETIKYSTLLSEKEFNEYFKNLK